MPDLVDRAMAAKGIDPEERRDKVAAGEEVSPKVIVGRRWI